MRRFLQRFAMVIGIGMMLLCATQLLRFCMLAPNITKF